MHKLASRRVVLAATWLASIVGPHAAALALAGCNTGLLKRQDERHSLGEQGSVEDVNISLLTDKTRVLQTEADLQASAKNLAAQQAALARQRAEAEDKLSSISQADKVSRQKAEYVQATIFEQERLLRQRAAELDASRAQLDRDKTALLTRAIGPQAPLPAPATAPSDASAASARAREDAVARREAAVASRERQIAERESAGSQALDALKASIEALRRDVNALASAPKAAVQLPRTAAAVSRGQLQRAAAAIHQKMRSKGFLLEDLPPSLQGFEQGVNAAEPGNDAAAAMALCDKVLQAVDATPINHGFVEGKMARINRALASRSIKLDAGGQKKIQQLLSEATDAFSDGRYDRANKKINQICALLPGPQAR